MYCLQFLLIRHRRSYRIKHVKQVLPPHLPFSVLHQRALREKFAFLEKVYWDNGGIWSKGFFVSTVGINEEIIRKYVQMQEQKDTDKRSLNCRAVPRL